MKLWKGRFTKDVDAQVNDFNASIAFDSRLYREDIKGSMAHAAMLTACGILTPAEGEALTAELETLRSEIESGAVQIDPAAEDIHTFIEETLTKRLGAAGKKLHTARSRNDQVATDFKLWTRKAAENLQELTASFVETLLNIAEANRETVMAGYTHLQRAQPVTFAHVMLAYVQMFLRDIGRLKDAAARMDTCPLGSGALASTTYPIDRAMTAARLGFAKPCENSMDGVADRDFALELLGALSVMMVHLSRFAEEIVLWCSHEFGYIELDDAFATGSSIMPQKKNPDVCELVRGKSGRVFGNQMALLTVMKGLPLAYNKDLQEDKETLFDAVDTVAMCLKTLKPMCETMKVRAGRMRQLAAEGFINATDCADYLVGRGLAFRDAYQVTGELVRYCIEQNKTLETLTLAEYRQFDGRFEADVYDAISLEACVRGRSVTGGPAPAETARQITAARAELKKSSE